MKKIIFFLKNIFLKYKFYFCNSQNLYNFKNYEEYKNNQIAANLRKEGQTWATEEDIRFVAETLFKINQNIKAGLCHGTRRGCELEWFIKYLGKSVLLIGTEISPSGNKYKNTIVWDFHQAKPEWLNSFDFIYSNALDHSYNPEDCLKTWINCLKSSGILVIEWSFAHFDIDSTDSFGASLPAIRRMLNQNGTIIIEKKISKGKTEIPKHFFFVKKNLLNKN